MEIKRTLNFFFVPLLYFFLFLAVYFVYFTNIFGEVNFVSFSFDVWQVIFFYHLSFLLGALSVSLFFSQRAEEKKGSFLLDKKTLYKVLNLFLIISLFGVFFKVYLAFKSFGFPSSLDYFGKVRFAFLEGKLPLPEIIQLIRYFIWIALIFVGILWAKKEKRRFFYFTFFFLLLLLDNFCIGGRADIFFGALCFFCALFLHKRFIENKSLFSSLLPFFIISLLLFLIFIFISASRGSDIKGGWRLFWLYFTGPSVAGEVMIGKFLEKPSFLGGYFTFGGFIRIIDKIFKIFGIDFSLPPLDFGYQPIFKNQSYGFNSFFYIAYLMADFYLLGIILNLVLGIFLSFVFCKFLLKKNIFWFLLAVNFFVFELFLVRDITSKWIGWWVCLFLSIFLGKVLTKEYENRS